MPIRVLVLSAIAPIIGSVNASMILVISIMVPAAAAERVIELLKQYDDKESKMLTIIEKEKSMLKALEIYNRY